MVIFIRHLNSFQCNMIILVFIDIYFKYMDEYKTSITRDVRTPFHCVKDTPNMHYFSPHSDNSGYEC